MAKEWNVLCKKCGNPVGYSDYSYQSMRDHGHSRPEYCDDCRQKHQNEKATMGVSYFYLLPIEGASILDIQPGALGIVHHPEREHEAVVKPSRFDESDYGVTPKKIWEIYEWLRDPNHRVAVVVGPTGSGKSTVLPYWLMEPPEGLGIPSDFFTRDGQILITQPRIVAAQGIATYMAEELVGGTVGKGFDIGYRHSKDRNYDWRNRAFQATDGSLINMIQKGQLSNLSLIIIDEAHERSLNIDTILRLLKKQLPLYPHLKIIIASATIDAPMFADYFGRDTAKIVPLEGKDIVYETVFASEDEKLPYEDMRRMQNLIVPILVNKVVWLLGETVERKRKDKDRNILWGDILAFLHGVEPIEETAAQIRSRVEKDKRLAGIVDVYTLYADLPEDEKEFIRQKGKPSRIRVIVSTNVAEASVTVDGVVFVVDSGLEYQSQWDADISVTRIVPVMISQANAKQRWGRSGRTRNGEVHCLYTEEQYDTLMLEYPVPAIQRSSMEDVILNAKAAGIDDLKSDWIQPPLEEEIERATRVLMQKTALDEDAALTEYGALLRYFPYATPLADLIMLADRFGCVVEIATLLPVIKNGGQRYFLDWDYGWDARTKKNVSDVHRALMVGCHDDIEFILKVYSLWSQPPGAENLSAKKLESVRKSWARAHYVRHSALEEMEQERDNLLRNLYGHRKESVYRPIDFGMLDRVRILPAFSLPEQRGQGIATPGTGRYEYNPTEKPEPGSTATYRSVLLPEWQRAFDQLEESGNSALALGRYTATFERQAKDKHRNANILSRLFIDQKFPFGSRFECRVVRVFDDSVEAGPLRLVQMRRLEEISGGKAVSEDSVYLPEEDVFSDIHYTIRAQVPRSTLEEGARFVGEVRGYDFDEDFKPIVTLTPVPEIEPFDAFVSRHREGDRVKVVATGYAEYPGDSQISLVVKEIATGLELLLEPEDLSFTYTSSMVRRIAIGTQFHVEAAKIDEKRRYVNTTLLPLIQSTLTKYFAKHPGKDGEYESTGEVIDIWEDGRIFLLLDWGAPEEVGLLQLVSVTGRGLCKPAEEFKLGEKYKIYFTPNPDRPSRASLAALPRAVEDYLTETGDPTLIWSEGRLEFNGRMSNKQLFRYKAVDHAPQYHSALEALYRFSNQLWVTKMVDLGWIEHVSERYPSGKLISEAVLQEKHNFGMILELEADVQGFVPQSMIFEAHKQLEIGSKIKARVVDINPERRNVVLNMKIPENDPKNKYKPGGRHWGTVVSLQSYGAFIQLEPGVDGLLHVSQIPGFVRHAGNVYSMGERVHVKVLAVEEKGIKLGLAS